MSNFKTTHLFIILGVLVIFGVGILLLLYFIEGKTRIVDYPTPDLTNPVACTMDAKMCPDGSYVGRVGPNCEFAQCPTVATTTVPTPSLPTATSTPRQITIRLKEAVDAGSVKISVEEVIEDSRCPSSVVCIQAGTVRLKITVGTTLGSETVLVRLGEKVSLLGSYVTLVSVDPYPASPGSIRSEDYKFVFEVL